MNEVFSGCGRQKATDVLRQKAKELERRAAGLRQLADVVDGWTANRSEGDSLPNYLGVGSAGEEALWELASKVQ